MNQQQEAVLIAIGCFFTGFLLAVIVTGDPPEHRGEAMPVIQALDRAVPELDKVGSSSVMVGEHVRYGQSRGDISCSFNGVVNERIVMARFVGKTSTNIFYPMDTKQVVCGEATLRITGVTPMQLTYEVID